MRTGRQITFTAPGAPLELRTADEPDPGPGSLLARVTMAGVCGTDAHRLAGDLPAPPGPINFGHEAVGVVEELGAGVTTDSAGVPLCAGDRIYWFPPAPCGHCHWCGVGADSSACENQAWPVPAHEPNPAGFREFSTLNPRVRAYRIPEGTPDEAAVAFGCAMPTALCGFERVGRILPGSTIVVQGAGPVGLAATLLAGLTQASNVLVIGAPASRLEFSRHFGATEILPLESTTAEERLAAVLELTEGRGADLVVEAAGRIEAFDEGMAMLGQNSRYLIMGLYSGTGTVQIDPFRLNNRSQRIVGTVGQNDRHIRGNVEIAARFHEQLGIDRMVTHRFPLEQTEAAIQAAGSGEAVKAVVEPGMPG